MTVVTVYAVFANPDEAQRIGRTIVEEKLAACVNILAPCHSIYRWQDKIEEATEVPALFKTTIERADTLIARVTDLHSYEIPAIAVWPIERLPAAYGNWVESEVR